MRNLYRPLGVGKPPPGYEFAPDYEVLTRQFLEGCKIQRKKSVEDLAAELEHYEHRQAPDGSYFKVIGPVVLRFNPNTGFIGNADVATLAEKAAKKNDLEPGPIPRGHWLLQDPHLNP